MITANFLRNSEGTPILGVDEWLRLAPPEKGKAHWKDYRSAKELAKSWFRVPAVPTVPLEVATILEAHPTTQKFQIQWAVPEAKTPLDELRGNTRNNDMLLFGHAAAGPTVVTIEAKADEEFASLIGDYRRSKEGTRSKVPDRIAALSRSIFGREPDDLVDALRYQLLHGFAAALIEARTHGAVQAVFLVHDFWSAGLNPRSLERNRRDLGRFVAALLDTDSLEPLPGRLYGPFNVPGGGRVPTGIPGYIGKVVTRLP